MRAAGVTTYGGPFESFDVPDPDPSTLADGQVIVRVAAAGMGTWDVPVAPALSAPNRQPPGRWGRRAAVSSTPSGPVSTG
jgi:NADPH:quinone reductase-like Zn-dependent oxidoreductase